MELIKTSHGKDKLCFRNYSYVVKKRSNNCIRWACSYSRRLHCRGSLTTDANPTINPRRLVPHNHPASATKIEVEKFRSSLKVTAAANVNGSTQMMIANGVQHLSNNALIEVGKLDTLRRDVQRQKAKHRPVEPADLPSIVLAYPWTSTGGAVPQQFLIYDNGPRAGNNRILIFAAQDALIQLGLGDTWYMDGNFKSSPHIFMQLYVIRTRLDSGAVTCVYAFLPGKSGRIYTEMFQAIRGRMLQLGALPNVQHASVDFEMAAYDSLLAVFGNHINIHGCFFHLTQSTVRQIDELGLRVFVHNDARAQLFIAMMDGLAYLPLADVLMGAQLLQQVIPYPVLQPLFDYFLNTYVLGPVINQIPVQRAPPMFPPQIWNVFNITLDGGCHTNNICEGWNHVFNNMVGVRHPSFYKALECIQKDYGLVRAAITKSAGGSPQVPRVRREYAAYQNNLKRMCQRYQRGGYVGPQGIIAYLVRVVRNIRLDI